MPQAQIPAGTVTFMFTDIEGSTKLWEAHPEAMRVSLARHDVLMRLAIVEANGYVFTTVGDAFCAAFSTAAEAVEAVLNAQLALAAEPWPEGARITVRMALHTGAVESRDDDYFGPPVNRAARLVITGYGGQMIVSAATQELVRDYLPQRASLLSLGEHRLKDLGRPESIYQLCHEDLPGDFPPLRSLDNPELKHNLPQPVTSFVGREAQIAEVKGLMDKARLLTLTGAGGCGKTRLALQVAADRLDDSYDGVWLVELAPLTEPGLVASTVANVLGLTEEPGKPILQTLTEHLRSKHQLLLLDNCEHLLEACAQLADAILRNSPKMQILATSREGLGISGETTYRVPSLSLPDPKQPQTPESLSQYEAVQLFIERAAQVQTAFAVTNQNAPALASICHRLDGIPLAIELAAARVRSLTVEDINSKLDHRFRLLTGGSRTALPRQQTLRSLIDWSYDLLNDAEKALLCGLSVFLGGWTLESAESVCAGESVEDWEMLDLLTSLGDKSLVVSETAGASVRYRLLETVREYAGDRLLESNENATWHDMHLAHFLAVAEEAEAGLTGSNQQAWLERIETEHDNLRAALEWSLEAPDGGQFGLRLAGALYGFWLVRGHYTEGRKQLARAISLDSGRDAAAARAKGLNGAGNLAHRQGDYAAAQALHEDCLGIRRNLGDRRGIAGSLNNLGQVAHLRGDHAAALPFYEEALGINRELGNRGWEAINLTNLGNMAHDQGDYAAAQGMHERSLAIQRNLGDRGGIAGSLNNLGFVAQDQGDHAAALPFFTEALAINRELGNRGWEAINLSNLGAVAHYQGDNAAAQALLEESLAIQRNLGDRDGIARSLTTLGVVAQDQGDYATAQAMHEGSLVIWRELGDRRGMAVSLEGIAAVTVVRRGPGSAARIWGASERLREEIGMPLPPTERQGYVEHLAEARTALNDDVAFDAAWAEGRALTLDQAMEIALSACQQ